MAQFLSDLANTFSLRAYRPALVVDGTEHSYSDLAKRALGIQKLAQQHAPEKRNFGLVNRGDAATYAAILACWFSGRTYLPIEPDHPEKRSAKLLKRAGIDRVFDSKAGFGLKLGDVQFIDTSRATDYGLLKPHDINQNAAAYILFTSGSTGKPKGVPISYANLNAFVEAWNHLGIQSNESDRWLQMADLTFDLSVMSFLPAWLSGGTVYLPGTSKPKYLEIVELARDSKLTILPVVPSALALLGPYLNDLKLESVKHVFVGAEPFPVQLAQQLESVFPKAEIWNFYGPTEATILATFFRWYRGLDNFNMGGILSIGRPVHGMKTRIIDRSGKTAIEGELCLGGPQVFRNYLSEPALFIDGDGERYYRTGDRVRLGESSRLLYLGRLDSQVQLMGNRVELGEIEAIGTKIADLPTVAVEWKPEGAPAAKIILFVEGATADGTKLMEQMADDLPKHMLPAEIRFEPKLPRTAEGTFDRKALKELIN